MTRKRAPAKPKPKFTTPELLAGMEQCERAARAIYVKKFLGYEGEIDFWMDLKIKRWMQLVRFGHTTAIKTDAKNKLRQELAELGLNVPDL